MCVHVKRLLSFVMNEDSHTSIVEVRKTLENSNYSAFDLKDEHNKKCEYNRKLLLSASLTFINFVLSNQFDNFLLIQKKI